jgi:hypothetical protein
MIVRLRHLLGWMVSVFSSREDLVARKPGAPSAIANLALHAKRPRRRLTALHSCSGRAENVLVRVDKASRLGHP